MKKQILFLTFFVLAVFAGMTDVFGQALPYSPPRPLSCVDDALHPIAGKSYDYSVLVSGGTDTGTGSYLWWATKDSTFISWNGTAMTYNTSTALTTASGDLVATSSNYNNTGESNDSVSITWSSDILAETGFQYTNGLDPTFVAVHYQDSCTDNFKVYEINPINGFTVDIKNIDEATKDTLAYDVVDLQCVDIVRGATYVNGSMVYDYGIDTMYFEVVAANFSEFWRPSFDVSGTLADQDYTLEWGYSMADLASNTNIVTIASDATGDQRFNYSAGTDSVWVNTTTATDEGVSIFVRLIIKNNTEEMLTSNDIVLAVNGQNGSDQYDVVNGTATDTCADAGEDFADVATQTVTPRPTVTDNTADDNAAEPNDVVQP